MRVVIIKSAASMWYNDKIGKQFNVRGLKTRDKTYFTLTGANNRKIIFADDCVEI